MSARDRGGKPQGNGGTGRGGRPSGGRPTTPGRSGGARSGGGAGQGRAGQGRPAAGGPGQPRGGQDRAGQPRQGGPAAQGGRAQGGRPAQGGGAPAGRPQGGRAQDGGARRGASGAPGRRSGGPAQGGSRRPTPDTFRDPGQGPAPRRGRGAGRSRPAQPSVDVHVEDGVRLQKVLASAGLGSRRACEELIAAGRVEVDGQPVTELGLRVDPATAVVHVDGMRVQLDQTRVTLALNKPLGVVSTLHDPAGRPTVADLVRDRTERLFHVGRLDADSEGLLLLTNDGELANRLAHPRYEIVKTYLVTVEGQVRGGVANTLLHGVELEDGPARVDRYRVVDQVPGYTMIEVELHEGRNRVVRRMFEEVGHPVTRLVRTRIGPIRLGDLRAGRTRVLGRTELGALMAQVGL